MINYKNISPQNKPLKSSSLTIRDDDGEIVGALSFNFDISIFHSIKTILDTFTKTQESDYIDEKELFKPHSIQAGIKQVLDTIILKNGWSQSHLSRQKKQQLIGQLNQQHIFHKKGSFSIVAQELSLSIPTVYTYLKKWKQDHNE